MKYVADTRSLYDDDGQLLKKLNCPLNKKWHELLRLDVQESRPRESAMDAELMNDLADLRDLKRHCAACRRDVINVTKFNDAQVSALVLVDPEACIYASNRAEHIEFVGRETIRRDAPPKDLCAENAMSVPIVHTARTLHAINSAAKQGYWPLLKPVNPSSDIGQKISVTQNSEGTVRTSHDYRGGIGGQMYWYNPYHSPLPFAAYLIPPTLSPGSRVYLADLIEDIVEREWNQGDKYRATAAYAIWDGADFQIEPISVMSFLG